MLSKTKAQTIDVKDKALVRDNLVYSEKRQSMKFFHSVNFSLVPI